MNHDFHASDRQIAEGEERMPAILLPEQEPAMFKTYLFLEQQMQFTFYCVTVACVQIVCPLVNNLKLIVCCL